MTTLYIDSAGKAHDPETMPYMRLLNGLKKREREGDTDGNYDALCAVRDRRKAEWEAANPQD